MKRGVCQRSGCGHVSSIHAANTRHTRRSVGRCIVAACRCPRYVAPARRTVGAWLLDALAGIVQGLIAASRGLP